MARQTTKRKVETPEGNAATLDEIQNGINVLRSEIDRLNWEMRLKELQIEVLRKENERLEKELNRARNK